MKNLKELCETAEEYATWAEANIWDVPITLPDVLRQLAEELKSKMYKEKVYGYSDDNVCWSKDEVGCFGQDVKITFTDGTQILMGYPKKDLGVWWVEILKYGTAKYRLTSCVDEDAEIYSDVFEIESDVKKVVVCKQKYPEGK